MNKFAIRPADVSRDAYEVSKADSDKIHQKKVHALWEKISDDVGTSIGHMRKYFQKRKDAVYGFLIDNSPAALWLSLQPVNTEPVITSENLDALFNKLNRLPQPVNQQTEPRNFFERMGNAFQRAINNAVERVENVIEPLDLRFQVAIDDIGRIADGSFVGPRRPAVSEAFNAFQNNHNGDEFIARVLEARGFHAIPNASGQYRLAAELREELNPTLTEGLKDSFGILSRPVAHQLLSQYVYSPNRAAFSSSSNGRNQQIIRLEWDTPTPAAGTIPVLAR